MSWIKVSQIDITEVTLFRFRIDNGYLYKLDASYETFDMIFVPGPEDTIEISVWEKVGNSYFKNGVRRLKVYGGYLYESNRKLVFVPVKEEMISSSRLPEGAEFC